MKQLVLTLDSPAANVALDEALLDAAEAGRGPGEVLRIWEPRRPLVVLGRSSRLAHEVNEAACRRAGVPIVRRTSGGATILAGPGCLMYALVVSLHAKACLRGIPAAHDYVMERHARQLNRLVPGIRRQGTSDLALDERKVSGNSLRIKRDYLLYHGTLLYDFPLADMPRFLPPPPRQPAYRAGRDHQSFLANLPASATELEQALVECWGAREPAADWPRDIARQLVAERYATDAWTKGERGA